MSAVAKFVALSEAGLGIRQAIQLSGLDLAGSSPMEQLLAKVITLGAPVSVMGKKLVAYELQQEKFQAEIRLANAVPLATRKLLLWLPALSLVIGQLAGFQTISALSNPMGVIAFAVSGLLLFAGARWSSKLLRPLQKPQPHPALELMQFSIALRSGQPLRQSNVSGVGALVELGRATGAPLGNLVESEIQLVTHRALEAGLAKAKSLSIELLVPMAITVLPAFLILTVVPMLIGIGF